MLVNSTTTNNTNNSNSAASQNNATPAEPKSSRRMDRDWILSNHQYNKTLRRFPENNAGGNNPASPISIGHTFPSNHAYTSQGGSRSPVINRHFAYRPETPPKSGLNIIKKKSEDFSQLNSNSPLADNRRVSNILTASLMRTNNQRLLDTDGSNSPLSHHITRLDNAYNSTSPTIVKKLDDNTNSFNQIISSIDTSEPKSVTRMSITQAFQPPQISKEEYIESIMAKGMYLEKYTAWHEYCSSEDMKKISKKVIERNNNMWELISQEYLYLKMLIRLRDTYTKSYPYLEAGSSTNTTTTNSPSHSSMSSHPSSSPDLMNNPIHSHSNSGHAHTGSTPNSRNTSINTTSNSNTGHKNKNIFESIESILPGLDPLIDCHSRVVGKLVEEQCTRPDMIITDFGRVLDEALTEDICKELSGLYGAVSFTHEHIGQKLNFFKKFPLFLSYLHKCERTEKKTISDRLTTMGMHLTKTITTLKSLQGNILNDDQEKKYVKKCVDKLDNILQKSSRKLERLKNAKELENLKENYEISSNSNSNNPTSPSGVPGDNKYREIVYQHLNAPTAELLMTGQVKYETKKFNSTKTVLKDVLGVALDSCMFFLQPITEPSKTTVRYQLFIDNEFPAILEWGKLFGYFREDDSKSHNSFGFYMMISNPEPSMRRLYVPMSQERNEWKEIIMKGFSKWQNASSLIIKNAELELEDDLKKIETKWSNTMIGLDLMKQLDQSILTQLKYRTVAFQAILEDEINKAHLAPTNNSQLTASTDSSQDIRRNNSTKSSSSTVKGLDQTDGFLSRKSNKSADQNANKDKPSVESYIPDLSTSEGIKDWLEIFSEWVFFIQSYQVHRLKFSLCSSNAYLTRSASEVDSRRKTSIQSIKKCETFTSRDSNTDKLDVNQDSLGNESLQKKKYLSLSRPPALSNKDQRRISVTSFTNLFRSKKDSNNQGDASPALPIRKSLLEEADDKSNSSPKPTNDNHTEENLMEFEAGVSYNTLSKDIGDAFNEVNQAAKRVTDELLEMRTKSTSLEAENAKLSQENKILRDYFSQLKKASSNKQVTSPLFNSSNQINQLSSGTNGNQTNNGNKNDDDDHDGEFEDEHQPIEDLLKQTRPEVYLNSEKQSAEFTRQENLRQMLITFQDERKKWRKTYQMESLKLENDKEKLFHKEREFENEKKILEEKEKKYKENCLNLQAKIDMHQKDMEEKERQYEEKLVKLNAEIDMRHDGSMSNLQSSSSSIADPQKSLLQGRSASSAAAPVHFRSSSDDMVKQKHQNKSQIQGNHSRHTNSGRHLTTPVMEVDINAAAEARDKQPPPPAIRNPSPSIPSHLRGSLINQASAGASAQNFSYKPTPGDHSVHLQSGQSGSGLRSRPSAGIGTSPTLSPANSRGTTSRTNFSYDDGNDSDHADKHPSIPVSSSQVPSRLKEALGGGDITSNTPSPSLGMPLHLAEKSKHKKDKKKKQIR